MSVLRESNVMDSVRNNRDFLNWHKMVGPAVSIDNCVRDKGERPDNIEDVIYQIVKMEQAIKLRKMYIETMDELDVMKKEAKTKVPSEILVNRQLRMWQLRMVSFKIRQRFGEKSSGLVYCKMTEIDVSGRDFRITISVTISADFKVSI